MRNVKAKISAAATVVALGGLAGLALSQGGKEPGKPVADKPVVHTRVIRRTVHVTKHAKPKHPPAAAPVDPAGAGASEAAPVTTGSSGTGAEPIPVTTGSSGGGESAPVTTASSGAGGGEYEEGGDGYGGGGEIEHEVGDD